MSLDWYATVDVLIILVDIYPVAKDVHGNTCGMTQGIAVHQPSLNDAGKDVACSGELHRYFVVCKQEVFVVDVVVAYHGVLAIDDA